MINYIDKDNLFGNNLPYHPQNNSRPKYDGKQTYRLFQSYMLEKENKNQYRQFFHIPKLNDLFLFSKFLFPKGISSCKSNKKICSSYRDIKYQ